MASGLAYHISTCNILFYSNWLDKFSSFQSCQNNLSCSCLSWQSCSHPGPCLLLLPVPLKDRLDRHCNAVHCYPPFHLGKQKDRKEARKKSKRWYFTNPISMNERILDTDLWYLLYLRICNSFFTNKQTPWIFNAIHSHVLLSICH